MYYFALKYWREWECKKEQTWKPLCVILSENIPDSVKSSGTVLEEPSCTILSPNILDTVESSGTDLKCAILFRVYQII